MVSVSSSDGSTQRRSHRFAPTLVVGLVVLALGLCCVGWAGYQLLATNVVARHAYANEADHLRSQWQQQGQAPSPSAPKPAGTTSAGASTKPKKKTTPPIGDPSAGPGAVIGLLRIPRFGSDFEVPILNGTALDTLAKGVGHYSETSMPGQVGNFAIAGHRITHGQPFRRLLDLDRGDDVVVETRTAVYTYVIDEPPRSLTVKANASWVLDPVPGQPQQRPTRALITLTTCQDLFHSPDRSIGFGHLASTKNKG